MMLIFFVFISCKAILAASLYLPLCSNLIFSNSSRVGLIIFSVKLKSRDSFNSSNRSSLRMHSVEKHFLSLKTVVENNPPLTNIWLSDYEKELATKILSKYNHSLTIGVGANFEGKIWDVSKYIELAKLLKNFFDVIILVGDKNDITISKEFISGYNGKIIN